MSEERSVEYVTNLALSMSMVVTLAFVAAALYQMLAGRVVVDTELVRKTEEGKAFSASKRLELPAGGTIEVLFRNDSGKTMKLVAIEVVTEQNIDIDVLEGVAVESSGNAWTIRNLNLGSDYVPDGVVIEDGGTYSGGTVVHQTIGYGGAKNFAVGSLSEVGEQVLVPSGKNILIRIANPSSTNSFKVSVRFLFYEP